MHGAAPEDIRAVELSVVWHTEGKGDEDMSVHFFERIESDDDLPIDFRQPRKFSVVLPNSPLSYNGLIVRICWCVRARVFFWQGRELSLDVPFQLGSVLAPEQAAAAMNDPRGQSAAVRIHFRRGSSAPAPWAISFGRTDVARDLVETIGRQRLARPNRRSARFGQVDLAGRVAIAPGHRRAQHLVEFVCATGSERCRRVGDDRCERAVPTCS